jgi:hypothetical protein
MIRIILIAMIIVVSNAFSLVPYLERYRSTRDIYSEAVRQFKTTAADYKTAKSAYLAASSSMTQDIHEFDQYDHPDRKIAKFKATKHKLNHILAREMRKCVIHIKKIEIDIQKAKNAREQSTQRRRLDIDPEHIIMATQHLYEQLNIEMDKEQQRCKFIQHDLKTKIHAVEHKISELKMFAI